METDRRMALGKAKKGLGLVLVLAALSLVLTGCLAEGTTTYSDLGVGSVRVSQVNARSTSAWPQTMVEYGVFYSTSRAAVVNVDSDGRDAWIFYDIKPMIMPPGLYTRVLTEKSLVESETGSASLDLKLQEGERYYFRWYGVAERDSDGYHFRSLTAVTSHVTLSHDASLKSIKTSKSTLSPVFSKTTTSYKVVLSRTTSSTKITVASTRGASTIQMAIGSGAWSTVKYKTVSVSRGHSKTVYVKVTATDGVTVKTYKVKVSRRA